MDIIVRHSRSLPTILDQLERSPRRILRRTHRMVPLGRVQELDRKAMAWLARQPGQTMAERGGDRQRIQAVAREESFNTLENRVLLSYATIAGAVAREYRERHRDAAHSERLARVRGFGLRCAAMGRGLRERGVLAAAADAVPNFVLQNNPSYHMVWLAWCELLRRRRELDKLWRWQARSWEEFCAMLVVVALQSIPGARMLAVSPLVFREDQDKGCWIDHVNPLVAVYVPEQRVIAEVSYRMGAGKVLSHFGAPIWIRLGRIDSAEFLSRWAVWPIWHARGGLEPGEPDEVAALLHAGQTEMVKGGITIRPALPGSDADLDWVPNAGCFAVGASGSALKTGIEELRDFMSVVVLGQAE
jgi:hypothetical protein